MDYDEGRVYYSYQNLQSRNNSDGIRTAFDADPAAVVDQDDNLDTQVARRHFREFLRNYRQKQRYLYRDRLLRMHQRTSGDESTHNNHSTRVMGGDSSSIFSKAAIEVDLAHVGEYEPSLLDALIRQPAAAVPSFELAAADALKTLLYEHSQADTHTNKNSTYDDDRIQANTADPQDATFHSQVFHIQILLKGNLTSTPLRAIQSHHMNTLIRCPGIVISASRVRPRATSIFVRCSRCQHTRVLPSSSSSGPFGGFAIPQRCIGSDNPNQCGMAPYGVVPDECEFIDQQTLKLQESPEAVPTGEMPRSILMAVDRALVDRAPPGTRVSVLAIASLFQTSSFQNNASSGTGSVKTVYLRVVGMERDSGNGDYVAFTPQEEEAFRLLARRPDVYDILSRSIAPSISGSYTIDIKKALTCQLFSGSRKKLPDGMRLRGDINVLLLGDPSMAKSQFLKYVTRVAPVGIYTSGKGSSAAGLTASVVRDQRGEFYLEGGAMVLADGGIVAIDEFDKMRPIDRVAIHEAMEQQTISVAKAGITTVLNSRSSVLAAANPVFGRYDDLKSASENIDLMSTILSRFDLIFLVRDTRDEERDKMICHHVMGVHMNNSSRGASLGILGLSIGSGSTAVEEYNSFNMAVTEESRIGSSMSSKATSNHIAENAMKVATSGIGDLDIPTMKKYIQYCKSKCSPRLSEQASDMLSSSYVRIRNEVRQRTMNSHIDFASGSERDTQPVIPITVRQLEALVRISESLAKMRLQDEVQVDACIEALRLFKVSTMAADRSSDGAIVDASDVRQLSGMSSRDDILRTESYLRSRLSIGAVVNKHRIVEEAVNQGLNALLISRVISVMVARDEIQEKNKGRLIKRIK